MMHGDYRTKRMMLIRKSTAVIAVAIVMSAMTIVGYAAELKNAYTFTYHEVRYSLGMDAGVARSTLGEVKASRDVNNCANGYINKAYTYGETGDFEVLIEQNEKGQEIVSNITLLTDKVSTEEGLKVGDAESRITQIYPASKKGLSTYTVMLGESSLYVKVTDGKVTFISYI